MLSKGGTHGPRAAEPTTGRQSLRKRSRPALTNSAAWLTSWLRRPVSNGCAPQGAHFSHFFAVLQHNNPNDQRAVSPQRIQAGISVEVVELCKRECDDG